MLEMISLKFKSKLVLGLGSLALTLWSFTSLSSITTITKTTSNSSILAKNSQRLKSSSSDWEVCHMGETWLPEPYSSCVKIVDIPQDYYFEEDLKNKDIKNRLEKAESDAKEVEELLEKAKDLIDKIRRDQRG